jgi:hypothetical protein
MHLAQEIYIYAIAGSLHAKDRCSHGRGLLLLNVAIALITLLYKLRSCTTSSRMHKFNKDLRNSEHLQLISYATFHPLSLNPVWAQGSPFRSHASRNGIHPHQALLRVSFAPSSFRSPSHCGVGESIVHAGVKANINGIEGTCGTDHQGSGEPQVG